MNKLRVGEILQYLDNEYGRDNYMITIHTNIEKIEVELINNKGD